MTTLSSGVSGGGVGVRGRRGVLSDRDGGVGEGGVDIPDILRLSGGREGIQVYSKSIIDPGCPSFLFKERVLYM
jgi:hypothetical protein